MSPFLDGLRFGGMLLLAGFVAGVPRFTVSFAFSLLSFPKKRGKTPSRRILACGAFFLSFPHIADHDDRHLELRKVIDLAVIETPERQHSLVTRATFIRLRRPGAVKNSCLFRKCAGVKLAGPSHRVPISV